MCSLRLPYWNDAEIAKFCNLWMFWPVIQLINHLFKIRQKIPYWLNYRPKRPKVASFLYGNLKMLSNWFVLHIHV